VEPILDHSCKDSESHEKDDMNRLLAVTLVLFTLVVTPAEGKGISAVEICGASGCRDLDRSEFTAVPMTGGPVPAPSGDARWFRVKVTFRDGRTRHSFRLAVVPGEASVLATDGTWMQMSYRSVRRFRRLARGIDPLPASALSRGFRRAGESDDRLSRTSSAPGDEDTPWVLIGAGSLALATVAMGAVGLRRRRGRS
jgi:hypothetical protein